MYVDQYVLFSLFIIAVMIVGSIWSVKKLKEVIAEDAAKADKE